MDGHNPIRAAIAAAQPVAKEEAGPVFVVTDIRGLLTHQFRPRECLLTPWLTTQSLTMAHAWRGVGKTHLALNVAYAVASGGQFLGWKAERPRKVFYLDGEMPGHSIQARLAVIGAAAEQEPPDGYFQILTPDMQPDGLTPNLADWDGQQQVNALIEPDTALIVVDNLSALARGNGRENDAESWQSIGAWALSLRAKGVAVLFIHHSGKSGAQRGTSKREDILDTVLCLKRPSDYQSTEGARFEIHFEKARGLMGDDVRPIEALLTADADGSQKWVARSVEDAEMKRAVMLKEEGASQADIAEEMSLSRHQVNRLLKRAETAGLVKTASFERGGSRPGKRPSKPFTEVDDEG